MRKIILDLREVTSSEDIQDLLAAKFDFPEYYGMNLDALYDCLTDLDESTCVGIFEPSEDSDVYGYVKRMKRVFRDAEAENEYLGVIVSTVEDNYEEEYL